MAEASTSGQQAKGKHKAGPMEDGAWNMEDEQAEEDEALADMNAFNREYENDNSWEQLQEDEYGHLRPLDVREEQRAKRRRLLSAAASAHIRRGMIRYLTVVLDMSRAASMTDMRPNRGAMMIQILQLFVREFFDQNPLSHLSIMMLRNGRAERLTELSGSPEAHISKLKEGLDAGGNASLQNGLDLAVSALKSVPPYGHREVLMLFAGLSTCDPGNILDTVQVAKQQRVRVSIVGLAAEVHICRVITEETGGIYSVGMSDKHVEECVMDHAPPPPTRASGAGASLVRMGFPQKAADGPTAVAFVGADCLLQSGGFTCPRCKARVLDLPSTCHVCGLTLVSSSQLARSYHHLFPVKPFVEVSSNDLSVQDSISQTSVPCFQELPGVHCHGCLSDLSASEKEDQDPGVVLQCSDCKHLFCFDCDVYVHESLHNCPGCEASSSRHHDVDHDDMMIPD
ncbi:TPA: hypothetical protein ACH3X1_002481 [Trebouxia sp. C0004]